MNERKCPWCHYALIQNGLGRYHCPCCRRGYEITARTADDSDGLRLVSWPPVAVNAGDTDYGR